VGKSRGVPDLSFDADPNSGVAVYDSTVCQRMSGWMVFGGTSVAAPSLAGVANLAGHFYLNSAIELGNIYATGDAADFRDITSGTAGKYQAKPGWDFVTGVGSPLGAAGK
jgi:subtilase family serine protease